MWHKPKTRVQKQDNHQTISHPFKGVYVFTVGYTKLVHYLKILRQDDNQQIASLPFHKFHSLHYIIHSALSKIHSTGIARNLKTDKITQNGFSCQ